MATLEDFDFLRGASHILEAIFLPVESGAEEFRVLVAILP
jgi:hypothetical protein